MSKDDFFIGWSPDMPVMDRRVFLGAGAALTLGTGVLAANIAGGQRAPGPGAWKHGDVQEWHGIATAEPYAMLRTRDIDGTPRTALLGCLGKCGVSARIGNHAGKPVTVRGSLIHRGRHAMIAVAEDMNWISEDPNGDANGLAFPAREVLDTITLRGKILDTKCWFGAMRPNEGKIHKSCAALCIRGGIPPAFFVEDQARNKALLIMTDQGGAHGDALLPFVADPLEITGQLVRWGEHILLDSAATAFKRV